MVFGWFIPRLNESLTKKRQLEKNEGVKNNGEHNSQVQQSQNNLAQIKTMAINTIKKPVAFKEFISS